PFTRDGRNDAQRRRGSETQRRKISCLEFEFLGFLASWRAVLPPVSSQGSLRCLRPVTRVLSFCAMSVTGFQRDVPFIWVTWISSLLSGDNHCEWAAWFRAHFEHEKRPSTFNEVK